MSSRTGRITLPVQLWTFSTLDFPACLSDPGLAAPWLCALPQSRLKQVEEVDEELMPELGLVEVGGVLGTGEFLWFGGCRYKAEIFC